MEKSGLVDQIDGPAKLIRQNVQTLHIKIAQACARAGRRPEEVRCVAISKGHPASKVRMAFEAGLTEIGENRVQEASAKFAELADLTIRWHLVGTLQTNKVRPAVSRFAMIQSLDRLDLAQALQKECDRQNRSIEALIQVEATGEPTKHGLRPEAVPDLVRSVKPLGRLRLRGLMAIGPLTADPVKIRSCFRTVGDLFQSLRQSGVGADFDILSMGMSDDFEIAIEEGSTLIRIGTLIFGPREQA